jgi:hypothetical protein
MEIVRVTEAGFEKAMIFEPLQFVKDGAML